MVLGSWSCGRAAGLRAGAGGFRWRPGAIRWWTRRGLVSVGARRGLCAGLSCQPRVCEPGERHQHRSERDESDERIQHLHHEKHHEHYSD